MKFLASLLVLLVVIPFVASTHVSVSVDVGDSHSHVQGLRRHVQHAAPESEPSSPSSPLSLDAAHTSRVRHSSGASGRHLPALGESCHSYWGDGTCTDTSSDSCSGQTFTGFCSGSKSILCCVNTSAGSPTARKHKPAPQQPQPADDPPAPTTPPTTPDDPPTPDQGASADGSTGAGPDQSQTATGS